MLNGDIYEGEFKDGVFSGKGEMYYKNLNSQEAVYRGMFRNHKRCGFGEMVWGDDKEKFLGNWNQDQRVKGELQMLDGSVYIGEFKNDTFHGKGKLCFSKRLKP